ncbi:MAG: methionine--tRNA ligase [Candidatus Borkfalkiaceae bacterium]|nr:methionine--tRNA ligase [Clostridia bacterium]MDY6223373.1 methionine--tRNA ligase [Christensenellaceae bacterium]
MAESVKNAEKKKFYITTAIAYASGKPHIGNTYEAVLADAIARFKRKEGYEVFLQTGTDEHGQKIEEKAAAAGVTPQEYVDKVSGEIRRIWDSVGTSYDKFIRTTDKDHEKEVAAIFRKFYEQGDIYKGSYEGWYCTPCESFFTESQLIDGKCPDCGREVKREKEEAYFFRMGKYADRLIEHIETHPDFIRPVSRKNEMMNNFLKKGLQDLCVSRTSFKWGIPVDFDDKHVVYVWLDALTNYITGIGYDVNNPTAQFKKLWPADLHLIGKDILRFHTIYWPIFLMALNLPLPKQVFGHPWLLSGEDKMSKSKGNVIYSDDLIRLFGVDATRYYVLHEMPFDDDGVISWDLFTEKYNSDLANVLGNLVSRTVAMIKKYFGGTVSRRAEAKDEGTDEEFKRMVSSTAATVVQKGDELRIAEALSAIMAVFRRANKYIDETAPWVLAKDEAGKPRLNDALYNLSQAIVTGASLLSPFLPETSAKILSSFGAAERSFEECGVFALQNSVTVTEIPPLFARADMKTLAPEIEKIRRAQIEEANAPAAQSAMANGKTNDGDKNNDGGKGAEEISEISVEDFEKVRLQVGEIVACEKVKKSSKLLHETVKFGNETRSVVSGIAGHYKPEELVGKKAVFVTNLKPVKLCGVLSEGMILAAEDEEGNFSLVCPEKSVKDGTRLG